jgi:spore coat polysaccharide biosynthesis predicted glycosyltransferase SpsG
MAALIADADVAVGAGGVSAWERCCLGLPSLMVTLADNQLRQIDIIVRRSAGVGVGWPDADLAARMSGALRRLLADGDMRSEMAQAAASLVDGRGPARIFSAVT